ncbi:MAG: BON domain-containing protein [Alphaproteobacteria bacterium]|nr:MAG: BON domain-containing protein [Alphaproteobacteria bacterium]
MPTDSQIQKDVIADLNWDPCVTASQIGVTARNGVVALTGHVGSYSEKYAAENAAGRVKGVKAVAEEIEVRLHDTGKRGDEEIAAAAVQRLGWNGSVPHDAIKVKVEKGWVTLSGEVEWRFQRDAAATEIRHLLGVVGVSDAITIKTSVSTASISANITNALQRSWLWEDDSNVKVTAQGGAVKLSGTVESWQDRLAAGQIAWAAPGTVSVENTLIVV